MSGHLIILGGTRGIGKAFRRLIANNFTLLNVIGRNIPEDVAEFPSHVRLHRADLTNTHETEEVLGTVIKEFGKVDGLVCFQRFRGKENSWYGNLEATLSATKTVINFLSDKFQSTASIVLIGSIASRFVADEQDEGYHAAKAGLAGLTRYYAFKLGPMGVRVNLVSPGTLLKEESQHFFTNNLALTDMYQSITPLRRMGTADEVAKVVRFLVSSDASFITGQEIIVDGGVSLHWQESMGRYLKQI